MSFLRNGIASNTHGIYLDGRRMLLGRDNKMKNISYIKDCYEKSARLRQNGLS